MSKRSQFVCQQCGYSQVGWAGKCPNCGAWNSLVESFEPDSKSKSAHSKKPQAAIALASIKVNKKNRVSTQIGELDRVLGGGLVSGQVILLAGEPGIGKSTILLQISQNIGNVFYVSGEESSIQVKLRADRLGVKQDNLLFLENTDVDTVIATLESLTPAPELIIIDSIQTMATSDLSGLAGSVGQVRECASRLLRFAKSHDIPLILVGHITKIGTVAGPAVLAHIVDTVLWFEGDKNLSLRLLRGVKNRFGPTDEVGIFEMNEKGLIAVDDSKLLFAQNSQNPVPGSSTCVILEGTRPILVEVQSLVVPSKTPYPRRVVAGLDAKRVELLLGVLTRRCGLPLIDWDVYVNVVGGLSLRDPSSDLAVALSIASAFKDKALPRGSVAIGEVGLLGEIRSTQRHEQRLKQAQRQGFKQTIESQKYPTLREIIIKLLG